MFSASQAQSDLTFLAERIQKANIFHSKYLEKNLMYVKVFTEKKE